jgi:CheY-like chemotaxis protein
MAENTEINVLITDDIEDNRLVLKNICRKIQNLRVFEAVNGEQAVETVKKQPIDIVLMDVMMPVMDGFEATGIIKKMENPPTVIVVTAIADKETENKFIELGVDGYIRKPIDRDIIKAKLEGLKNTITLRKGAKTTLSSKKPISKLAKKCRNYKTYFFIENEDDAMDFGLWLTDEKTKIDNSFSFEFEDTLAAIYKICSVSLKANESVTIVVEGDFENLFATIILPNHISCDTALSTPSTLKNLHFSM